MIMDEAKKNLELYKKFVGMPKEFEDSLNMAIHSLKAWDEVIHSLNCLDRLEYTDCDKPFRVYPKSNVDAIINKYMKEVEDDNYKRKHGKWIERNVTQDRRDAKITEWQSAKCSVCGKYHMTPYVYSFTEYDYCPNCGSKMDERREDDKE